MATFNQFAQVAARRMQLRREIGRKTEEPFVIERVMEGQPGKKGIPATIIKKVWRAGAWRQESTLQFVDEAGLKALRALEGKPYREGRKIR